MKSVADSRFFSSTFWNLKEVLIHLTSLAIHIFMQF